MQKICYIILLSFLASCSKKSQDADIFNGEICEISDSAVEKEVEFKELRLSGPNYGYLSIHDSIAFFMNPQLPDRWYQLFNCRTLGEIGQFARKGNGHKEFIAVEPIWNFYKENNDLKTLIFDINKESVSIWNITQSIADGSTVIEREIKLPWKKHNRGACFKELFMTTPNTLYAKVSTVQINDHEATLPYYQVWNLEKGELLSEIHIFKKNIINKHADYMPETYLYSTNAIKPDGSKIVQGMLHVPQLNIIDTRSQRIDAYHLNYGMSLSDLETANALKSYFVRVCADDEHIYAAFYGNEWNHNGRNEVNKIYVFNWDGLLVSKVSTNHCIGDIAVDHINKILYTTSPMDEKLYYINTNELIENISSSNNTKPHDK